jgi:hypothetical protein
MNDDKLDLSVPPIPTPPRIPMVEMPSDPNALLDSLSPGSPLAKVRSQYRYGNITPGDFGSLGAIHGYGSD